MDDQILKDLDALLASSNGSEEIGETGLRVMEKCATTDVGLRALYSRCAASPLATIKNAFSFTLARRSRIPSPMVGEITFDFVEKLEPPFTPQVLLNTFSAIETNHISGVMWGSKPKGPRNLFDVIKAGFEFQGETALLVRHAGISVVVTLYEVKERPPIAQRDRKWLRDHIEGLTDDDISFEERAQLVVWLSAG